jgi:TolA-binding protein
MKRILTGVLAAAAMAAVAAPALAQGTRPADGFALSERQDDIARRIDTGVASGSLTDLQAADLRDQFKGLLDLQDQYRKSGLTLYQREDLQARYDTLSERLKADTDPGTSVYRPATASDAARAAAVATDADSQ